MKQYIDKSALVAEINRLIKKNELYLDESASDEVRFQKTSAYSVLCDLRHFLDTLEVKDSFELTVEDIKMLDALLIKMWNNRSDNQYEEVLKQFKVQKESKL